jgi:hypothetical protein
MPPDPLPERDFEPLGWYSPGDARRFLEALESAGIEFHTEVTGGAINVLVAADPGLMISVDAARRDEAVAVHTSLFGDALPNYESGWFQEHPPANEGEPQET